MAVFLRDERLDTGTTLCSVLKDICVNILMDVDVPVILFVSTAEQNFDGIAHRTCYSH